MNLETLKIPEQFPADYPALSYLRGFNGANRCQFTREQLQEIIRKINEHQPAKQCRSAL